VAESLDHQDLNSDPLPGGRILPQYQRVFGAMRDAIRGGAWPVGTALDSEDALSLYGCVLGGSEEAGFLGAAAEAPLPALPRPVRVKLEASAGETLSALGIRCDAC
jgi:hypothetical protein